MRNHYIHTHTVNPAVFISSESRLVLAGNTTTLVATVHAHPSPDTAGWYLNGNQIDAGDHGGTIYSFTIDSTMYTLRIQNIQEGRLGLYEFVATIGNQTTRDSITLTFPGAFDQIIIGSFPSHPLLLLTGLGMRLNLEMSVTLHVLSVQ